MLQAADYSDAHLRVFERPPAPAPAAVHDVYLIGICGKGMGALAELLAQAGYRVRGSDAAAHPPMSTRLAEAVDVYEINGFGLMEETPVWDMLDDVGIAYVGEPHRPFQGWSHRRIEVREGVSQQWIDDALPRLRDRLDKALGLQGRRYLRWDEPHLHLYLKRQRSRPRDLALVTTSSGVRVS